MSNLIDLIQKINVDSQLTSEPVDLILGDLDNITDKLYTLDEVQKDYESNKKLKQLIVNAGKLLKNLKFMKEVFDSTDGFTTTEEEDETYYGTSKDLFQLIGQLEEVIQNVETYNQDCGFDDIDNFEQKTIDSIAQISDFLENHKDVLENIDWMAKLGRRKKKLEDAQQETREIIDDANRIKKDLSKIYEEATKDFDENKELIEKFDNYIQTVNDNIKKIKDLKADF